jgi:hypothetical protein
MKQQAHWLSLIAAVFITSTAHAATGKFCIWLKIKTDDDTGKSNDQFLGGASGTDHRARHIYVSSLSKNGVNATLSGEGGSSHISDENGCMDWTASGSLSGWTLTFRSKGNLNEGNLLYVFNTDTGQTDVSDDVIDLTANQTTNVYHPPHSKQNVYGILAYAIDDGFRGDFDSETLNVYVGDSTTSEFQSFCPGAIARNNFPSDGEGHICLAQESPYAAHREKFTIAHEYGHANLYLSTSDHGEGYEGTNQSWFYGDGSHNITSLERTPAAALEGWADFVATDIWNSDSHTSGNRDGWFKYDDPILGPVNIENGVGTCLSNPALNDASRMPAKYADTCWSASPDCQYSSPDGCDYHGVQLDYSRFFYDYHSDGVYLDHDALQHDMEPALGFNSVNFWDIWAGGLADKYWDAGPDQDQARWIRFDTAADTNGITEPQ